MSLPQADSRIIDIAPASWCKTRLAGAEEGLLSYPSPHGRVALAVPYAVSDEQITIPLAPFNCTGWLAEEQEATLEVMGVDGEDVRWTVRATGTAQRAGSHGSALDRSVSRRSHPAAGTGWPAVVGSEWLVLTGFRLRGFYETPRHRASARRRPNRPTSDLGSDL